MVIDENSRRNHFPQIARTEGGAYYPECNCGWYDTVTYQGVDIALASAAVHMFYPRLDEEYPCEP